MKALLIFVGFFVVGSARAQVYEAFVYDISTRKPVADAVVLNMDSKMAAMTGSNGQFLINGLPGHQLRVVHPGFADHFSYVSPRTSDTIFLIEHSVSLEEVTVSSELAKFRKDSADRRIIYKKVLEDAGSRPRAGSVSGGPNNFGFGVSGLFSELALRASGKKKAYRRFVRQMLQDEQNQFIALRYNAELVMRTINTTRDVADSFIVRHPMPVDFARQASDVEIKMWIRERWRKQTPR